MFIEFQPVQEPIHPSEFASKVTDLNWRDVPTWSRDELMYHILWPVFKEAATRTWPVLVIDELVLTGTDVKNKVAELAGYAKFRGVIQLGDTGKQYMFHENGLIEIDIREGSVRTTIADDLQTLVHHKGDVLDGLRGKLTTCHVTRSNHLQSIHWVRVDGILDPVDVFCEPSSVTHPAYSWMDEKLYVTLESKRTDRFVVRGYGHPQTTTHRNETNEYIKRQDGSVQRLSTVNESGELTTFRYDRQNRLIKVHGPTFRTKLHYTDHGRRLVMDSYLTIARQEWRDVQTYRALTPITSGETADLCSIDMALVDPKGAKYMHSRTTKRVRANGDVVCKTTNFPDRVTSNRKVYRQGRLIEFSRGDRRAVIKYRQTGGKLHTVTRSRYDCDSKLAWEDRQTFDASGRLVAWSIFDPATARRNTAATIRYGIDGDFSVDLDRRICSFKYHFVN